jgi:hypothetical protein
MKLKKRTLVLLSVMVVAVAAAIGAYAYWTTTGSGTGSAQTGNIGASLHVTQTSDTGPSFTPGGTGQVLGGTVESTVAAGGANVYADQVVATLATPTGGSDTPNACSTDDYEFVNGNGWTVSTTNTANDTATYSGLATNLAPGASVGWSGLKIDMVNKTGTNPVGNQDGCKGALVHINYSAS